MRLGELERVHLGHDDVGDEQVDLRAGIPCERDRLARRRRLEHAVARALERELDDVAHDVLVIDNEHCSAHAWMIARYAAGRHPRNGLRDRTLVLSYRFPTGGSS